MSYSKKTGFFKEQNAGFSAQIHSVTPTKPGLKKCMLALQSIRINLFSCLGDFYLGIHMYIFGSTILILKLLYKLILQLGLGIPLTNSGVHFNIPKSTP